MTEEQKEEFIGVTFVSDMPYDWAMGPYSGRLFEEMRDNKKLWGIRCPGCKRLLFPPEAMCGYCFTEVNDDWVEMKDTGTLVQFTKAGMPVFDNRTGMLKGAERPLSNVQLDDGPYIMHWLEETDIDKLKLGMRVQAVWREHGRGRGYEDIMYFRIIEESSND
ncbi:MAG: OB-fold domain-containing protein [Chloroflexota bacterium]|nr:OB-fold domain-containing protein [Chloroflexota bacterium]